MSDEMSPSTREEVEEDGAETCSVADKQNEASTKPRDVAETHGKDDVHSPRAKEVEDEDEADEVEVEDEFEDEDDAKKQKQLRLLKAKTLKKRRSAKKIKSRHDAASKRARARRREKAEEVEKAYLSSSLPHSASVASVAKPASRSLDAAGNAASKGRDNGEDQAKKKQTAGAGNLRRAKKKSRRSARRSNQGLRHRNAESDDDAEKEKGDAPSDVVAEMASLGSELSVPHVAIGDESEDDRERGFVEPKSEAAISANEFASLQAADQRVNALKADMQRLHVAFAHAGEVDEARFVERLEAIMQALTEERKSLHRVQKSCNEARAKLHQELEDRSRAAMEARVAQKKRLALPAPGKPAAQEEANRKKASEPAKPKRRPGPIITPNPQASLMANLPWGVRSPVRQLHEARVLAPVRSERR